MYKIFLNDFFDLVFSPSPNLVTPNQTWDKDLRAGSLFWRHFLDVGVREVAKWDREQVKFNKREHYWGPCCGQQDSIPLGSLKKHPDASWNWAPAEQEGGEFTYVSHSLLIEGYLGNMSSFACQDVGRAESGELSVQGRSEHTWNCPLHLQLTSEIGQADVEQGTSHVCYKYLGRKIKIKKSYRRKWLEREIQDT